MLKTERWSQRIFPWNGGFAGSPVIGSQIITPFAGSGNVTPARFKNSQSTRYSAGGGGKGSRGWPSSKDSDSLSTVATRSVEDPVPPVFSKSQIDEGLADKTTADGLKGSLLGTNPSSASLSLYTDSPKSESISTISGSSVSNLCSNGSLRGGNCQSRHSWWRCWTSDNLRLKATEDERVESVLWYERALLIKSIKNSNRLKHTVLYLLFQFLPPLLSRRILSNPAASWYPSDTSLCGGDLDRCPARMQTVRH